MHLHFTYQDTEAARSKSIVRVTLLVHVVELEFNPFSDYELAQWMRSPHAQLLTHKGLLELSPSPLNGYSPKQLEIVSKLRNIGNVLLRKNK